MPMLRTDGQRPARVRPLHAYPGRRLRAVPPAGARARRRPGRATSARSSAPSVRPLRPARPDPGRLRRRPRDDRDGAGTAPSSCWTGRWPTPAVALAGVARRAPRRSPRRAAAGPWPCCWPTWTTASTPTPRPPPAGVAGARDRRALAGRVDPRQGLRAARLVARPPARTRWWVGDLRLPAQTLLSRPPRSRSRCTAGTSTPPRAGRSAMPDDLAGTAARRRAAWWSTGDTAQSCFAPPVPPPPGDTDVPLLLGFLGRG